MTRTVTVNLSDTVIKKHAADVEIRELRDQTHPVRFRYRLNRKRGSFYVIRFTGGKSHWHKIGNYPDVSTKTFFSALPDVLKRLEVGPNGMVVAVSGWATVGDLLNWYVERVTNDGHLSKSRKATTRSAVKRQLLPCLGSLPLGDLNRASLDSRLMWPLQAQYSVAHVRLVFSVFKVAIKRAHSLGLVGSNPLLDVTFTDFIKTKIQPKAACLRPSDAGTLLDHWAERYTHEPAAVSLALLMLTHGTRIGETRQAKWRHFDLPGQTWHIPAVDTKTKKAHTLPLTPQVCSFLNRYRSTQVTAGYDGAYLFPGSAGRSLNEKQAQDAFICLSGEQWTSHDLRKTARTAWADLGVDYLIGELLLNHALKALDVTYIHTTAEVQKRKALERWHAWLDERGFAGLHMLEKTAANKT